MNINIKLTVEKHKLFNREKNKSFKKLKPVAPESHETRS